MDLKLKRKEKLALLCGLLSCVYMGADRKAGRVCMGVGDWLMLYGNTAYRGNLSFTNGLMSESMLLWDLIYKNNCLEENDGKY